MGYALYGNEIDETITPLEAGLGWIVKLDKGSPFIGDKALAPQKARGVTRKLVGFQLDGRGFPRHGYPVFHAGREVDIVRSGTMSPSLGQAIGTTYLPAEAAKVGTRFEVECRGERMPAEVVKRPFYTQGNGQEVTPRCRQGLFVSPSSPSPTPAAAAIGPIPRAIPSRAGREQGLRGDRARAGPGRDRPHRHDCSPAGPTAGRRIWCSPPAAPGSPRATSPPRPPGRCSTGRRPASRRRCA